MSQVYEKKFRLHRCFSAVLIILFFYCFGHTAVQANKPMDFLQPGKLVLFIVKFDILVCSPCLNPFLDFYHLLPYPSRENMVWGIVVYDNPEEKGKREVYRRIVEKKSRGFFKANNISCPVVFDHSHGFKIFSKKGTTILLFDREKKILRKYIFPLNQKQKKEILNILKTW